jgi:hypothetical protein
MFTIYIINYDWFGEMDVAAEITLYLADLIHTGTN